MTDHLTTAGPTPPGSSGRAGMHRIASPRYAGPLLAVTDFACRSEPGAPSTPSAAAEVPVPLDALLFVRRGAIVTQLGAAAAPSWRRAVLAAPGDVLLLRGGRCLALAHPAAPHPGRATLERGDRTTSLRLADHLADEVRWHLGAAGRAASGAAAGDPAPIALHESGLPRVALHLQVLRAAATERAGGDALAVEARALALLEAVRAARAGEAPAQERARAASPAHRRLVERARELVAAAVATAPGTPLSLQAIAASVGASPFHLSRTFRALMGVGLHHYRTRLRLHSALDRVADERHSLAAIALDLGYSSQAHFTTAFRRVFGATPGAWRARRRELPAAC